MERYHLFRGNELIYSTDGTALGAGNAHMLGRTGDVLIREEYKVLQGFRWNLPNSNSPHAEMPWLEIKSEDLDPKYRVLLMLQL